MSNENTPAAAEPLAQMSVKDCGMDPKEAVRKRATVFMVRIFGEASAMKTKTARSGDAYSYFIGNFGAINANGKEFVSDKLFLPGSIAEKLEVQLSGSNGAPVEFGYDIYSTEDTKATAGFRYASKTVIETAVTNRLEQMSKELATKPLPGAAAPAPGTAPVAAPAPAAAPPAKKK